MGKETSVPFRLQWQMRYSWTPLRRRTRNAKWLRLVSAMVLLLRTFYLLASIHRHRRTLFDKYGPTLYTRLSPVEEAKLASRRWQWHWQWHGDESHPERGGYSRDKLMANRGEWEQLASGFEGEAFTYRNCAIKVYNTHNAPFRNCIPGAELELRWPTEISASLVLGGLAEDHLAPGSDFLPVVDYFLAPPTDDGVAGWHFVTPYMPSGNLESLGRRLRESETRYAACDLDMLFRSSFNKLLNALRLMHDEYDLCHDDIKPDNIFLKSPGQGLGPENTTQWLLADLGNVRQLSHPYHSSLLWVHLSKSLPDCRANDVFRLLKTYLAFIRSAVHDVAAFDGDFLQGGQPWSRLFWATKRDIDRGRPVAAAGVLARSTTRELPGEEPRSLQEYGGGQSDAGSPLTRAVLGREYAISRAVTDMLRTRAGEDVARRWGLVPLLGVPVPDCSPEK
ncbi:hypothetical protein TOPH_08120 [Tolypocladium ophioglossoides CBS 100239]|uniref:Protein kinase domain-containing protein n=1 Tax=Tolypocladium ophioglossoides (strain CBS 100239) TaxID=1163406 RepID=A0A0L0MZN1_TOLOC|nr:hypothetical protein TOPH_08120 [Tolypocladium ophioglossoides CBS 100239]